MKTRQETDPRGYWRRKLRSQPHTVYEPETVEDVLELDAMHSAGDNPIIGQIPAELLADICRRIKALEDR
jgi:hypothetical protein